MRVVHKCEINTIPKRQPLDGRCGGPEIANRPWYKFMKQEYAEELCGQGRFRLSNLFYYRHGENLASGIHDISDGRFDYDIYVKYMERYDFFSKEPAEACLDCRFGGSEYVDDAYVFCASSFVNAEVRSAFPEYDTLVQIINPKLLIAAITNFLEAHGHVVGAAVSNACQYMDFPITDQRLLAGCQPSSSETMFVTQKGLEKVSGTQVLLHPAFVKHRRFENQREVRVVWRPATAPQQIFVNNHRIAQVCRIVDPKGDYGNRFQFPDADSLVKLAASEIRLEKPFDLRNLAEFVRNPIYDPKPHHIDDQYGVRYKTPPEPGVVHIHLGDGRLFTLTRRAASLLVVANCHHRFEPSLPHKSKSREWRELFRLGLMQVSPDCGDKAVLTKRGSAVLGAFAAVLEHEYNGRKG